MLLSKLFNTARCCLAATALLLLGGCASNSSYNWGWYVFNPLLPKGLSNIEFLISGVGMTLALSVTAILLKLRGRAMQAAVPVGIGAMCALLGADTPSSRNIRHNIVRSEIAMPPSQNAQTNATKPNATITTADQPR